MSYKVRVLKQVLLEEGHMVFENAIELPFAPTVGIEVHAERTSGGWYSGPFTSVHYNLDTQEFTCCVVDDTEIVNKIGKMLLDTTGPDERKGVDECIAEEVQFRKSLYTEMGWHLRFVPPRFR